VERVTTAPTTAPREEDCMKGPRTLPRVAKDIVHILDGRRVVSVQLPPRGPVGSDENYRRAALVGTALRVRKVRAPRTPSA
jgi:hypothetical protein